MGSPPAAGAPAGHSSPTTTPPPPPGEACPLCGSPLHPEQEWCLHCGAAARTRLAASPNWKAPIAAVLVVLALSLGVLAAALVKLAGNTGPGRAASTTTVTTAAATVAPTQTAASPPSATPGSSTPSTSTPAGTTPAKTRPNGADGKARTPATGAAGSATTTPRTGSSASPSTGIGGVSKDLEERIRKQARSGK